MDDYGSFARFYDLDLDEFQADVPMAGQFAARCGSPVLELGCGTGRILLSLARQGYRVTGVDRSPAMLDIAHHKVANEGFGGLVTLVRQDMRYLDLAGRFNLALVMLNSFMHLTTAEDQMAALQAIRRHLCPGGLLVLDLFSPDLGRLLDSRGQVTLDWVKADPDTGHTIMKFRTESVDLARQLIHVKFIIDGVDGQGIVRRSLISTSLRYLFHPELEHLLLRAGFEIEAVYGSYDLDEVSSDSGQLIAVARRPD